MTHQLSPELPLLASLTVHLSNSFLPQTVRISSESALSPLTPVGDQVPSRQHEAQCPVQWIHFRLRDPVIAQSIGPGLIRLGKARGAEIGWYEMGCEDRRQTVLEPGRRRCSSDGGRNSSGENKNFLSKDLCPLQA